MSEINEHHSDHNKEHHSDQHKTEHSEHKVEHHKSSPKTYVIEKLTVWKGVCAILGILLIISLFTGGFGIGKGAVVEAPTIEEKAVEEPAKAAQPQQEQKAPAVDMKALMDDDSVKGDLDAPVTIVEWSDFECPFCARFYSQTYGQIVEQYIDTGKVKLVFRDFPLGFHANAQKSAEAAECAGEQGKYYEMHDLLFENGVKGGVSAYKQFAIDIGLDASEFNDCLDSGKMAAEVAKDMKDGQAAGVRGTPGFIINGELVSGAQPFENFKRVIDAALAE